MDKQLIHCWKSYDDGYRIDFPSDSLTLEDDEHIQQLIQGLTMILDEIVFPDQTVQIEIVVGTDG